MDSGIYKITNTLNNKFYIGSSCRIKKRYLQHRSLLKRGEHQNFILQRVYDKYGIDIFRFETLAICPKKYLQKLEQWFIDTQKPYYNLCKLAYNNDGVTNTPKAIQKRIDSFAKRRVDGKTKEGIVYNLFLQGFDKTQIIEKSDMSNNDVGKHMSRLKKQGFIDYKLKSKGKQFIEMYNNLIPKNDILNILNITKNCYNAYKNYYKEDLNLNRIDKRDLTGFKENTKKIENKYKTFGELKIGGKNREEIMEILNISKDNYYLYSSKYNKSNNGL